MGTSHDDTSLFVRETLDNSQGLLTEARLLFTHERWARAFALAILAQEEAAKALLTLAEAMPHNDLADLKPTRHEDKLTAAALTELVFFGDLEDIVTQARQISGGAKHREKLAALYVDLRSDGLHSPASITRESAQDAVAQAENLVLGVCKDLRDVTDQAIEAAIWLTQNVQPRLDEFAEQHGHTAGLQLARSLMEWAHLHAMSESSQGSAQAD